MKVKIFKNERIKLKRAKLWAKGAKHFALSFGKFTQATLQNFRELIISLDKDTQSECTDSQTDCLEHMRDYLRTHRAK